MSFKPDWWVSCDAGCGRSDCPDTTREMAWKAAQEQGWVKVGNRHYCPTCAAERKQKKGSKNHGNA